MATTQNTYTGNGTNKLFNITFPYLDTTDIDVFLNGTLQTVTTQYTFANATTVEFVTAPANGATVLLSRSTDDSALQATFFPGSSIKAADLNYNFDQVLYLSQETANNAANQSTAGLQAQITAANNTSNNAITIATAANTTANGIAGTANTALSNSSAAVSTANAASVTATNAETTANAISAVANAALPKAGGTMTGNLNVVSLNGGQLAGTRNRIINGDMRIDQRNAGASQTFTAAAALAYSVDRWYGYCTGANVTGQQITGATAGQFRYRFTGAASVTAIGFGQRIEQINSADLASTTATLSVDLANSLLTSVTWTAYYATTANTFGTLAAPTRTQIATGTFTVSGTVTRYSTSISIPAAATTGIEIVFTVGAQTSGTWTIGDVQLEPGSVATPFERRSYGQELALCQRYYYQTSQPNDFYGRAGTVAATTYHPIIHEFPVIMRIAPNYSAAAATFTSANTSAFSNTTTQRRHLTLIGLSNTPDLDAYYFLATGSLTWSAEL
jgi:hypothetical protein